MDRSYLDKHYSSICKMISRHQLAMISSSPFSRYKHAHNFSINVASTRLLDSKQEIVAHLDKVPELPSSK
jgi:hypothetical protein